MASVAAVQDQIRTIDPDEERAFMDAIDRWMEREVLPVIQYHDHNDIWPEKLVEQMSEMGLFGATIGQEYGGLGLPATTYAKIVMRISSHWMAITGIFNSHLIMAAAVERFGTLEQKMKWLPKFATGEIRGGLALTEPNAGTDLQAIRTVAKRDGDDYVLNGTKTWISNAVNGSCFALLAKTDPQADPRYKGMSLFIADKRADGSGGLTTGKKFDKLGYKAIDSAELVMEDYRIPADQLIGGSRGARFLSSDRRAGAGPDQCGSARRRHGGRFATPRDRICTATRNDGQADCAASGDPVEAG